MRERGYRVTPQRQTILDAVCEGGDHLTPEEIYARVQKKSPAINLATIYRNLEFLCEMRLVVAVQIGGQMRYEIAGETPHHHLVCRTCNKIEVLGHESVRSFFARLERDSGFVADMDHLAIFGLCKKCKRNLK